VAAAFATADDKTAARLNEGLGSADLDADGVAELREIIVSTGALARTEERIANLTEASLRAIGMVQLAGGATAMLTELAGAATRRAF
jgi:geranylgeranyl diphosphate synthase type I